MRKRSFPRCQRREAPLFLFFLSAQALPDFAPVLGIFGAKILTKGAANQMMAVNSIVTMPLRSFSGFTGGLVSESSVDGLVDIFNKKKGGFRKFLKGFKKSKKPQR